MSKFDAKKFLSAQDGAYGSYKQALAEIKNGKKVSHWIWYIFPQIEGLGHSSNSQHFAISSLNEARQYLADDVLRKRLIEISEELLKQEGSAESILGKVDAMKVRSSMTLFKEADISRRLIPARHRTDARAPAPSSSAASRSEQRTIFLMNSIYLIDA